MTTYERLVSELGDGLGTALAPDGSGLTEVFAEDRAVLLRADETGEDELTVFATVATASGDGFSPDTLKRALAMNLFGREVAGHHLGLFADTLILSAALPIPDLSAEGLAERIVMVARLANKLADALAGPAPADLAGGESSSLGGEFLAV